METYFTERYDQMLSALTSSGANLSAFASDVAASQRSMGKNSVSAVQDFLSMPTWQGEGKKSLSSVWQSVEKQMSMLTDSIENTLVEVAKLASSDLTNALVEIKEKEEELRLMEAELTRLKREEDIAHITYNHTPYKINGTNYKGEVIRVINPEKEIAKGVWDSAKAKVKEQEQKISDMQTNLTELIKKAEDIISQIDGLSLNISDFIDIYNVNGAGIEFDYASDRMVPYTFVDENGNEYQYIAFSPNGGLDYFAFTLQMLGLTNNAVVGYSGGVVPGKGAMGLQCHNLANSYGIFLYSELYRGDLGQQFKDVCDVLGKYSEEEIKQLYDSARKENNITSGANFYYDLVTDIQNKVRMKESNYMPFEPIEIKALVSTELKGTNSREAFKIKEAECLKIIKEQLNEGFPVVANVTKESGSQHYVTIVGYANREYTEENPMTQRDILYLDAWDGKIKQLGDPDVKNSGRTIRISDTVTPIHVYNSDYSFNGNLRADSGY